MVIIKKIIIIIFTLSILACTFFIYSYLPKNFQSLLGSKNTSIVEIQLKWKDHVDCISDPDKINQLLEYFNSFTYIKKTSQEISQDNLQNNTYQLKGAWFINSNNQITYMDFFKNEVRSGVTYYYIPENYIDENTLQTILSK